MSKVAKQVNRSSLVLKKPRVTEKSAMMASDKNPVYVFEVSPSANKHQIKDAVESMYKVYPLKVNMINTKAKTVFIRGKRGKTSGFKKAMVYLKSGDKIEFA